MDTSAAQYLGTSLLLSQGWLDLEKNTGQPVKPNCQVGNKCFSVCVPDCMRHTCHKQFFVVNRSVECCLFSFPVLKLGPRALWMPGKHSMTELTAGPYLKSTWSRVSWLCSPAPYLEGVAADFHIPLSPSGYPTLPSPDHDGRRCTNSHITDP